jgi:hypothetical protein
MHTRAYGTTFRRRPLERTKPTVPKFRRLFDGLLLQRTGLNPGPVDVGNVVDKLAVGQDRVFIEYFVFSCITLPVLHSLTLMS